MDAITILVLADPVTRELALLERLPDETVIAVGKTPEAFERTAPLADVILIWEADVKTLEQIWRMAPRVRWMHTLSAGLDNALFPGLVESPVVVTNARGVFSDALGEFAMGAMLFFAKDIRRLVRNQLAGVWEPFDVVAISGQTVGIVGYGDIGRAVASRAYAMGMKVLALRRRPELSREDAYVAQMFGPDQKREMLAQSDYVVVTMPLTPESRGLIGQGEFEVMKPTAVLINIGRGPVVDEAALIRAIEQKRIRGAALDVFDVEPLPPGHPFYQLENVLLSPHSADNTADSKERSMRVFLENFERFRRGEPLVNVINKKLGY